MQLVICEKPSLAKNVMSAIGNKSFKKEDGYYENSEYIVTWAFGHLFGLLDIEEYYPHDVREEKPHWTLEGLPFCPKTFRFGLRKDRKTRKVDPGVKKQFNIIKKLCHRKEVTSIINAGDSDREGEIIVRIILEEAGNKKPVMRLWMPDQTPATIRAGLKSLKNDSAYDALANEGYARTYIDWLYGINLTRLATIKTGTLQRTGRVIVPIVKAIYDRDMEIRHFVPQKYIGIVSKRETNGSLITLPSKRTFELSDRSQAAALCDAYNEAGAVVRSVEKKNVIVQPGKLFSIDTLQGVLGKRFKMTPKEALDTVQSLYELGYVTYPRTDTEYLATAERDKINGILSQLQDLGYKVCPKDQKKTIYDDTKIESHSALTPTNKLAKEKDLNEIQWKVYSTILNRFLAVFCSEDCVVSRTTMVIQVGEMESFKISGDVIVSRGWMQYEDNGKKDKYLPELAEGDVVNIDFQPIEKETTPPKHYTVESLGKYLKNPFRKEQSDEADEDVPDAEITTSVSSDKDDAAEVSDDEDYRNQFAGVEIGTQATRTSIIENAIRSKYIELKKNTYYILPAGEYLIESLQKLGIHMGKEKTVELGRALKKVYRGELSIQQSVDMAFREVQDCFDTASGITLDRSASPHAGVMESIGKCPKCGSDIVERKKLFGCVNRDCRFALWKDDRYFANLGKTMTKTVAKSLLEKGQVNLKGCISNKSGKKFDCTVTADFSQQRPQYKINFHNRTIAGGR